MCRTLEQNADRRRISRIGRQLARFFGNAHIGHRHTHVRFGHTAEQLVEVFQLGRTARKHDAVGEFRRVARILDFLLHELCDVGRARFDDRCEVAQQNIFGFAGRAAVDTYELVLGRQLGDRRTIAALEAFDMFFGNPHRADVAVDGRSAHRDGDRIAHYVAIVDRDVGDPCPQIDYGDTLLLFFGQQHRLGSGQCVGENAQHLDTEPLQRHIEPLDGSFVAQDEIERRGEFLAERADGVLHLLAVVDHVVLRDTLHDGLVVGRLHVAHAVEQRIDIALADPRFGIEDIDMVRMARAPHEIARNAGVSLRDADAQLGFDLRDGFPDGPAHQLDVVDPPGVDPLHGLRDHGRDVHPAVVARLPDGDHDGRRT